MDSQSSFQLIQIGLAIRLLRNLDANTSLYFAYIHIEMLEKGLTATSFTVSLTGMHKLLDLKSSWEEEEEEDMQDKLHSSIVDKIHQEIGYVEKIVFAEANTKRVYTFPKRRFNEEYLLNYPENLFKSGRYARLSDISKSDIAGACRCILFGEATASAFHILRATEEVLKLYYFKHKKRKRLKKPMWGPMTIELRAKKTNKPSSLVLNSLDLVRTSYRNPTQHPEAIYDIESAQDLMGVCIDLINRMAAELPTIS
ncbi:hypothetical protein [Gimesia fumaroli]|uniref:DUF4145 domain-containing protein n=1 Tax=Gimesia fumaroli TaxID=2527976 RepID=A0A518IC86_9PLAN|nr:hypothetical protein [Gimesia fumaroli]QDV50694.1 hypothetical protein Enr17x_27360 [Gimesia fumaroli]